MRIIYTTDTKENMCDSCLNEFASCDSEVKFGDGVGNDNVISCDGYIGKFKTFMLVGALSGRRCLKPPCQEHTHMDIEDLITQLVDDMEFDVVVEWAKVLEVEVNPPPIDDMWPDWQSELRGEVAEAMMGVGEPKEMSGE